MAAGAGHPYRRLPDRRRSVAFALEGLALLSVGALLSVLVASAGNWMNDRELGVNTWFEERGASSSWLNDIASWFSWIGAGQRTVQVLIVVTVLLLITKQWRWAVFLVVCSQGGALLSTTIKHTVGRDRPPFGEFDASQLTSSFPSGHTFAGVTAWVAMGIILLYVLPRPWSTYLAVVPVVIGLANAPSRLLLGRHWVSDVLGAWLLASGWLLIVWAAFLWLLAPREAQLVEVQSDGEEPDSAT